MNMKRLCILLVFAMAAGLSAADSASAETKPAAAAKPAAASASTSMPAAKPVPTAPSSVLTSIYRTNPDPSEFADPEKAEKLLNSRAELVQKIHDERKRLLEEDAAARKLREEIMLLNRKLASLLETKKSMIELNSKLLDVDLAISRLKPAPPPAPASENDGGKADKE